VVEFRHGSWAETDIAAALEARGVACATTDRLDVGAPLAYLRLLGTENAVTRFDAPQIDRSADVAAWAGRLADAAGSGPPDRRILVYVRNFFEGARPGNAVRAPRTARTARPDAARQAADVALLKC
jgi:hypothetical protein